MLQKTAAKGLLLSMGVTGAGTATVLYGNSTQTSALWPARSTVLGRGFEGQSLFVP